VHIILKTNRFFLCIGIFHLKGRAKWAAWQLVSSLTKDEARRKYIQLVKSLLKWSPESSCNVRNADVSSKKEYTGMGNAVSSFAVPEDDTDDNDKIRDPIFSWARDNDLTNLQKWVSNVSLIF